jgi:hypothetical protein
MPACPPITANEAPLAAHSAIAPAAARKRMFVGVLATFGLVAPDAGGGLRRQTVQSAVSTALHGCYTIDQ